MRNNKSLKDARELSGLLRFKVTEPNTANEDVEYEVEEGDSKGGIEKY